MKIVISSHSQKVTRVIDREYVYHPQEFTAYHSASDAARPLKPAYIQQVLYQCFKAASLVSRGV